MTQLGLNIFSVFNVEMNIWWWICRND